jgi:F0F1-type ATP synthase membrane subunit a
VVAGNAVFFKCFQAFADILQAYIFNVLVVSDVCFKCFIGML